MISFIKNTPLGDMFNRIRALNEADFFVTILSDKKVQSFIVKLNTNQLKEGFMDATGKQLSSIGGPYSDRTVEEGSKSSKFNVDLFDEGPFHESFRIENVNGKGFEIVSDPVKDDGTNLLEEWGVDVEGLTFASLERASHFLLGLYQRLLLKTILGEA